MNTSDSTADGAKIAEAVLKHLGPQERWIPWPGGYPSRPDLALVDAVMSIRARYGSTTPREGRATGVVGAVARYRDRAGEAGPDWIGHLASQDPHALEDMVGRSVTGGSRKAAAIVDAAKRFHDAGVFTRIAFDPEDETQRRLYTQVPRPRARHLGVLQHAPRTPRSEARHLDRPIRRSRSRRPPPPPPEAGAAIKAAATKLGDDTSGPIQAPNRAHRGTRRQQGRPTPNDQDRGRPRELLRNGRGSVDRGLALTRSHRAVPVSVGEVC